MIKNKTDMKCSIEQ